MTPIELFVTSNNADCAPILSAVARHFGFKLQLTQESSSGLTVDRIILSAPASAANPSLGHSFTAYTTNNIQSSAKLYFSKGPNTPKPFEGRMLTADCAVPDKDNGAGFDGEAIASVEGQPIWCTSCENGLRRDTCCVATPWMKNGECAFDHLDGRKFMSLLPVVEWFRSITDWRQWEQPALHSCFMFDDPNLHSARYGFIQFKQLAEEGKRHSYHTSFATVPLDTYFTGSAAARIFRENKSTLSLLIHGNNHSFRELSSHAPAIEQYPRMQQAITRISKLERAAGLSVARVMAPPHGRCSVETISAMKLAGFEALCVSNGSLRASNPEASWVPELGLSSVNMIGGLPVYYRFNLTGNVENQVLLSIYFNQPIIPMAHHWDLADGIDILSSAAKFINGFEQIVWSDMASVSEKSYRFKIDRTAMRIRLFSRNAMIAVPPGVTEMRLEMPWADPLKEKVELHFSDGEHNVFSIDGHPIPIPAAASSKRSIRITIKAAFSDDPAAPLPRTPPKAIIRRVLVEMRDRAMPFLPRRFVKT